MARRVVGVRVVQVVSCQQRKVQLLSEPQQVGHGAAFDIDSVVHNLTVEILFAEDVTEVGSSLFGLAVLAKANARLDLAARASGGRDQAGAVHPEKFAVHPGLEVVAID